MTNEQIKQNYAEFLKTGIDYTPQMLAQDEKTIRRAEFISQVCIFTAGLLAGVILYTLFGVQA